MSTPTHADLAAAQSRQDWALLWQHAIPVVRGVVKRLGKGAVDEDMLQEGLLIAGLEIRAWRPLECAFSTWVGNKVRWGLSQFAAEERNHGIGGRGVQPAVVSLGDACQGEGGSWGLDFEEGPTFEAALTYEGVVRPGGQMDGSGTAPEGYGDPSDEAGAAQRDEDVKAIAGALRCFDERDAVFCVLGGEPLTAYAARRKVTPRTVRNWLAAAQKNISKKLPLKRHK